jgi:hypothetical protein
VCVCFFFFFLARCCQEARCGGRARSLGARMRLGSAGPVSAGFDVAITVAYLCIGSLRKAIGDVLEAVP